MHTRELVVIGRPVSQQARRRERLREWKDRVRTTALRDWSNTRAETAAKVALTLFHLYRDAALDIDNIIKPVQDALVGLAFEDDRQVSDLVVRTRPLGTMFRVESFSAVLAAAIDSGNELIYVRIEAAPAADVLE